MILSYHLCYVAVKFGHMKAALFYNYNIQSQKYTAHNYIMV